MVHDDHAVSGRRRIVRGAVVPAVVAAAVAGGGCDMPRMPELPRIPGVYRVDIQQGNVVDQAMVDQLEIDMERRKVRFILGTPLLVDPFNPDRWDYFYNLRPGSGPEIGQRLSVYFVDDRLARIENHLDPRAVGTEERSQSLVKVPKRQPREGLLHSLVPDFLKRSEPSEDDEVAGSSGTDTSE